MAPTKEAMKKAFLKAAKLSLNDLKVAMVEVAGDDMESRMPGTVDVDDDNLEVLLNLVDGDGDKKLTYEEFVKILESKEDDLVINAIRNADTDGSGYLTHSELKELMLKDDPKCKEAKDTDEKIDLIIKMTAVGGEKKVKVEDAINLWTKEDPKHMMRLLFLFFDEDG